jgi:hypothetical protein
MSHEAGESPLKSEQVTTAERLSEIFIPYAVKQRAALFGTTPPVTPIRMVHYTTAEAALRIIQSTRFWMRNTNSMADYREVQHGFEIFADFFSDPSRLGVFTSALDACSSGSAKEAIDLFNESWRDTRFNTYIACMSEHRDSEDQFGRLSMWRGFGAGANRVGIVLKIPWYSEGSAALNLHFNPVAYLSKAEAHQVFVHDVVANIKTHCLYLRTIDKRLIVQHVFMMLLAGVVCLKHEGFKEESEWRAIYFPKRWPSPLMAASTEVIAGIPQVVYKIPLDVSASAKLADLEFSELFDRLIVGPTPHSWPMFDAFVGALTDAGVKNADQRMFASSIPIRW